MAEQQNQEGTTRTPDSGERARAYYRQGFNCAECVFQSFLDSHETGLPQTVIGLSSGFGGGIGHSGHLCGAISGALLALGTQKGRNPMEKDSPEARSQELREEVYPRFGALFQEAQEHFGTVLCAELTAAYPDFDSPERKESCSNIVAYCAELCARHAESQT